MKNKTISSKSTTFVRGGNTKMFGPSDSAQQQPGQSATTRKKDGPTPKNGFGVKGGSTKMFGKQTVKPAKPC